MYYIHFYNLHADDSIVFKVYCSDSLVENGAKIQLVLNGEMIIIY